MQARWPLDVVTICYAWPPAWAFLLTGGAKGKRPGPSSRGSLIHQPMGGGPGARPSISKSQAREILYLKDNLEQPDG